MCFLFDHIFNKCISFCGSSDDLEIQEYESLQTPPSDLQKIFTLASNCFNRDYRGFGIKKDIELISPYKKEKWMCDVIYLTKHDDQVAFDSDCEVTQKTRAVVKDRFQRQHERANDLISELGKNTSVTKEYPKIRFFHSDDLERMGFPNNNSAHGMVLFREKIQNNSSLALIPRIDTLHLMSITRLYSHSETESIGYRRRSTHYSFYLINESNYVITPIQYIESHVDGFLDIHSDLKKLAQSTWHRLTLDQFGLYKLTIYGRILGGVLTDEEDTALIELFGDAPFTGHAAIEANIMAKLPKGSFSSIKTTKEDYKFAGSKEEKLAFKITINPYPASIADIVRAIFRKKAMLSESGAVLAALGSTQKGHVEALELAVKRRSKIVIYISEDRKDMYCELTADSTLLKTEAQGCTIL